MAILTYDNNSNVRLSQHFCVSEFACKGDGCCEEMELDGALVTVLELIRQHFNAPVTINSGYRCKAHYKAVGGAAGSLHTKGMAADIVVQGVPPLEVARYAEGIGVLGIGLYADFVHVDTRGSKAYWFGHDEQPRTTFLDTYRLDLPLLKQGSKGNAVKAVQTLLMAAGFDCGIFGADGDFGGDTDTAVRAYQKSVGIVADGCVGAVTMGSLLGIKGA